MRQYSIFQILVMAFAIVIVALPTTVFPQSEYLQNGQNGLGANAGVISVGSSTGLYFEFGLAFKGRSDIDILMGVYGRTTVLGLGADYLLLKQSDRTPVSLQLGLAFEHYMTGASLGGTVQRDATLLSTALLRTLVLSDAASLQPSVGVSWSRLYEGGGRSTVGTHAGLALCTGRSTSSRYMISAAISRADRTTNFSVSIGFVSWKERR